MEFYYLAMKKLLFPLLAAAFLAISCTGEEEKDSEVTGMSIVPSEIVITEGRMESLSVAVEPEGAKYLFATWSSSDETVAKVNKKGTLKAIAPGSAIITAKVGEVSATCQVRVEINVTPVSGISLEEGPVTVSLNGTRELIYEVLPADAADKTVLWSSSDNSVATVEDGVVSGISEGSATIKAKTNDGGFEASCAVNVLAVALESVSFANGRPGSIVADAESTWQLVATFEPEDASYTTLYWQSSDESRAKVREDEPGKATVSFSSKPGPVSITASAARGGVSATQDFFIKTDAPLYEVPSGKVIAGRKAPYSFNAAAYPGASEVRWSVGGRSYDGTQAMIALPEAGTNDIDLSFLYEEREVNVRFGVNTEQWLLDTSIPGANPRNTYPVFNKSATRAYFVTRGKRLLYEIDLEKGSLGWVFDMNEGRNDNGGDICVNPLSGDIYCSNQTRIFCLRPDGSKRWEVSAPGGTSASAIAGCGPALSNDCSVVFFPTTDGRLLAVDASAGTVLDSYPVATSHLQMAVYGANLIVLHTSAQGGKGAIKFLQFAGGDLIHISECDSPSADPTDITSPAISRDQKTAWFPCNNGLMVTVDLENRRLSDAPKVGDGYNMAPCLVPSGWLLFASQTKAVVNKVSIGPAGVLSDPMTCYTNGGTHYLNFTGVACDTDSNVYFFVKEDGAGNSAFYRLNGQSGRFTPEQIASYPRTNTEPQGFFNFGGDCLIGGGGNNNDNRLVVRCIDAERAHTWSGPGGDICATKNANLVYSE